MKKMRVNNIRQALKIKLNSKEFVTDKSGVKTIEILNASFIADEPALFGTVNEDYVKRELDWYLSMSLNVNDIPGEVPAIWKMVADKDGFINSNYGWCIYSKENGNQFIKVAEDLAKNPDSRRANMIYTRPSMHEDYDKNGMSDFMCTNNVQYVIRNGQLHALVYMRSNDAIFGYKNDYAWQRYVQESLLQFIKNKSGAKYGLGNIYWNVSSLHVYERHFNLVEEWVNE
jgi:thymidylate synthase